LCCWISIGPFRRFIPSLYRSIIATRKDCFGNTRRTFWFTFVANLDSWCDIGAVAIQSECRHLEEGILILTELVDTPAANISRIVRMPPESNLLLSDAGLLTEMFGPIRGGQFENCADFLASRPGKHHACSEAFKNYGIFTRRPRSPEY